MHMAKDRARWYMAYFSMRYTSGGGLNTEAWLFVVSDIEVELLALCYVLLNIEPGSEEKVLNEVRKVQNVKDCHRVYGVYDMIAKVEAESMDSLKEIVTWKIRRLEGVRSTLTTIVIE